MYRTRPEESIGPDDSGRLQIVEQYTRTEDFRSLEFEWHGLFSFSVEMNSPPNITAHLSERELAVPSFGEQLNGAIDERGFQIAVMIGMSSSRRRHNCSSQDTGM